MDDQNNPQQTTDPTSVAPVTTDTTPEQEPATQPMTTATSDPVAGVVGGGSGMPTPEKKSRKKLALIISLIAAVFVIVGGALAYAFYYQNPDKVITDSLINMTKAKSSQVKAHVSIKDDDVEMMVMLDGASSEDGNKVKADVSLKIQGQTYDVTADAITVGTSEAYVKLSNVKKVVDNFKAMIPVEAHKLIDDIVTKVDGTWIKVTNDDIDSISAEQSKVQKCVTETFEDLETDKGMKNEITKLYKKNRFITVEEKLGSKDGSLGYILGGDKEAAKNFVTGLKDTKLYKQLNDCDKTFTIEQKDIDDMFKDDASSTSDTDGRIELWVSRFTHQVTKLSVTATEKGKTVGEIVIEPTFNEDVTIEAPKDSTTVKQLMEDVQKLVQDMQASMMQSYQNESMYRSSSMSPSSLNRL